MNTPNPLLPQGATPSKASSSIGFKILMILAIHVVVIGGLLMQGCSKDKAASVNKDADTTTAANNSPIPATPDFGSASNNVATTTAPVTNTTVTTTLPVTPAMGTPAPLANTAPMAPVAMPAAPIAPDAAPVGETHDYTIVAGDTLGVIAKRNGLTVKSILDANPGLDPKKLRINHKIQLPAGKDVAAASSKSASSDVVSTPSGDVTSYTIKSGDRLIKIASAHGTTVKALLALNDMKTTAIRAGQKIKVPVMKVASADSMPAPTVMPVSAPVTSPASPMPATAAN